jgi:hypothetical protein
LTNTTPSAPIIKRLRDISLDVAATPPRLRRGMLAPKLFGCVNYVIALLTQEGVALLF